MSEEQTPNSAPKPETPAAEAKPAAAAPAAKPAPPPPEPGPIARRLEAKGYSVEVLAPDARGCEQIRVEPGHWLSVAAFLRDDSECRYDLLTSVTGVDWKDRREAVYHFYSTELATWLAVKVTAEVQADEQDHIPSVMDIWPAADWHEREAYDLLGIHFDGHPNLTRILMPDDWVGYPLRKDYKENDPRLVWNRR